jgi:hypothetical protein
MNVTGSTMLGLLSLCLVVGVISAEQISSPKRIANAKLREVVASDWVLTIESVEDGLSKVPVIGGLSTISTQEGEEGFVMRGTLNPTRQNADLHIDLRHYKLLCDASEKLPVTMDVTPRTRKTIQSVQWPGGKLDTLSKDDFPASVALIYLTPKSATKLFTLADSRPTSLQAGETTLSKAGDIPEHDPHVLSRRALQARFGIPCPASETVAQTIIIETSDGNKLPNTPLGDVLVHYGMTMQKVFGVVPGIPIHVEEMYGLCVPLHFIKSMTRDTTTDAFTIKLHDSLGEPPISGNLSYGHGGDSYRFVRLEAPFETAGVQGQFRTYLEKVVRLTTTKAAGGINLFALEPSRTFVLSLIDGTTLALQDMKWHYRYPRWPTFVTMSGQRVLGRSTDKWADGTVDLIRIYQGDSVLTIPFQNISTLELEKQEHDIQSARKIIVTLANGEIIVGTGIVVYEELAGEERTFDGFTGMSQRGSVFVKPHHILRISFPYAGGEIGIENNLVPSVGGKSNDSGRQGLSPAKTEVLPPYRFKIEGPNVVRIRNPNPFKVTAGLRKGEGGVDFEIPNNGVSSVQVPDGQYKIYFVYASKPDALFQGDSFTLEGNGVEIQIVKVVGGNYGIRQVK